MMKKSLVWLAVLVGVAGLGYIAYAAHNSGTVSYQGTTATSTASVEDTQKLNEIRNREDIKKQQELIVQETYLSEEKASAQADKDAAIKKYDSQIADIEKKLEDVRAQKMSFQ